MCYGFLLLKILDLGKLFRKEEKIGTFFYFFLKIVKILKIRDGSFVALLILRRFI